MVVLLVLLVLVLVLLVLVLVLDLVLSGSFFKAKAPISRILTSRRHKGRVGLACPLANTPGDAGSSHARRSGGSTGARLQCQTAWLTV